MKRIINLVLICFICIGISAQLPRKSRDVIRQHYPKHYIKQIRTIDKLYWVSLSDNTLLKFKKNGELIEILGYVPVLLIPYQINNHMLWHHPNKSVRYYYKHKKGYDIHLKDGKQLKYNKRYKFKK